MGKPLKKTYTKNQIDCDYLGSLSLAAFCRTKRHRRLFLSLLSAFDYGSSEIAEKIVIRHIATIETMIAAEMEKDQSFTVIERMQKQLTTLVTVLSDLRKPDKQPEPKKKGLLESFNDSDEGTES